MDARALSDFSIEHLLSPEVGSRPQVEDTCLEGPLRPTPGGPCPWAPAPVPMLVPVPVCLQYRGFTMDRFCPCRAGLHHPNFPGFIPSCALFQHFVQNRAGPVPPSGKLHGCSTCVHLCDPPPSLTEAPHHSQEPQQPRQKARMRTVFTEAQSRQLEALFQVTDYPTAEARAELSARTGLTEETIRVSSLSISWLFSRIRTKTGVLLVLREKPDPQFCQPTCFQKHLLESPDPTRRGGPPPARIRVLV